MITRITLENYMSHKHTVIEPAAGLTLLVGPNNCGKSAVLSAVETLCSSSRGEFMVRHGERDCRVIVETNDGHTVIWQRRNGSPSYVIDGCAISRLQRTGDALDRVHDVLKLGPVTPEDDSDPFDIHFAHQKRPIFLLDEPPSRAAVFFAASSDAARLLEMQKVHRQKVKDAQQLSKRLDAEIVQLEFEIEALKPVDHLENSVEKLQLDYENLQQSVARAESAAALLTQISKQSELTGRHQATCTLLLTLEQAPPLVDERPLQAAISSLTQTASRAKREAERATKLERLRPVSEMRPTEQLQHIITLIEKAERAQTQSRRCCDSIAPLTEPPQHGETQNLSNLILRLLEAEQQILAATNENTLLLNLPPIPELQEDGALTAAIVGLQAQATQEQHFQRELRKVEEQLAHAREDMLAWAAANPHCPTCGAIIVPERLIEGGHAHG